MATDDERTTARSTQLRQAHDTLRQELSRLRSGLGTRDDAGEQLPAHCIAFCDALRAHHAGEDDGGGSMFAEILRTRPDLEPVTAKLIEDHHAIAAILTSVRTLAHEAAEATQPRRDAIGRELDGLAAIVESHFSFEERAIGATLDAGLSDTGWTTPVFDLDRA